MKKIGNLEFIELLNGLVFFSPVSLLVRTQAGISMSEFFILQAILSFVILACEIPTGLVTDRIGYKNSLVLSQSLLCISRALLLAAAFSIGSLVINFFYVDKLMNIGIKEEWMSLIIILYSLFQMLSEKILNVVPRKRYRILMLTSATIGETVRQP